MNAATLALDCAESTIRRRLYLSPETVQQYLTTTRPTLDDRMKLYSALSRSLVWVTECEVGLGETGPFVELRPLDSVAGRILAVFTSRSRTPAGDAEPVAFADLLAALEDDVAILIDPLEVAVIIPPTDVALLREVVSEDA